MKALDNATRQFRGALWLGAGHEPVIALVLSGLLAFGLLTMNFASSDAASVMPLVVRTAGVVRADAVQYDAAPP